MPNNRIEEMHEFIDNNIFNNINKLIKLYEKDLINYEYIEKVEDFSTLSLKGPLKYINKYDGILRAGGLLIKLYIKNNKWYAIIKQLSGKKYHISFNSNHIFYIKNKKDLFKDWMKCFISNYDAGKYS